MVRRRMSVKDLPVTKYEVLDSLKENNLDKFFVEFNGGYFSNHLGQAAVALCFLGVSKEKYSAFIEHYLTQLEPAANSKTRKLQDKDVQDSDIEKLKGQRSGFYKIRQHFKIQLEQKYCLHISQIKTFMA